MGHSFNPEIAIKVGVNAAILYENIRWWCAQNEANGRNFHEGRHWTFNSIRAWSVLFPYLTDKQIRTALQKLEDDKFVISGSFNKSAYDRTKWYCPSMKTDLPLRANGIAPEGKPIPDINTNNKPDIITPYNPPRDERAFDEFWKLYPRRQGRRAAEKAFERAIKRSPASEILQGLTDQLPTFDEKEKKFVPHPSTWLNQDRWKDELQTETSEADVMRNIAQEWFSNKHLQIGGAQ